MKTVDSDKNRQTRSASLDADVSTDPFEESQEMGRVRRRFLQVFRGFLATIMPPGAILSSENSCLGNFSGTP